MSSSAGDVYDRYWEEGVDGWKVGAGLSTGMAELLRSLATGADVLDYGGGDGLRYASLLRQVAKSYIVADISPKIIEQRQMAGDRALLIDALRDSDVSADVLVMSEVLEHLLDPLDALRVATSKIRPGGRVLLTVPNAFSAWNRLRMLGGRLPASGTALGVRGRTWIAPHIRFFDWTSLKSLATESGIETETGYVDGVNVWKLGRFFDERLRSTENNLLIGATLVFVGRKPVI